MHPTENVSVTEEWLTNYLKRRRAMESTAVWWREEVARVEGWRMERSGAATRWSLLEKIQETPPNSEMKLGSAAAGTGNALGNELEGGAGSNHTPRPPPYLPRSSVVNSGSSEVNTGVYGMIADAISHHSYVWVAYRGQRDRGSLQRSGMGRLARQTKHFSRGGISLTTYCLLLSMHYLLLSIYWLLLTGCCLPLTAHYLLFTAYCSLLTTYSLLLTKYKLLNACYYLFTVFWFLLTTDY